MEKKLYRDELNKKVAGVCAGLAEYLNVDVTIIRVLFLLALIFKGGGGLIYLILWAALPKKPLHLYNNPNVDYTVPPQNAPFNPFAAGGVPPNVPFSPVPPKKSSNAGLIGGIILVLMGSFFLLDQLDLIPFWDFGKLWPVILIIVGAGIMFSGKDEKPNFTDAPWNPTDKKEEVKFTENDADNNTTTDKTEY
ncbi:PspC domain-containing protein [Mucilaginibacter auburnensis]|uniref:Phage shock protein C n=1 Tax=Mucilaginibacter auburnensis TaxID=1457233 RepID=A0A2H9VND9_9SPHI|nr:PspC domain-containing protein [Mucilaginibacter auburnensis]PJJ79840.1 phage shock protein C [Mucilaginibacter auburnensis]